MKTKRMIIKEQQDIIASKEAQIEALNTQMQNLNNSIEDKNAIIEELERKLAWNTNESREAGKNDVLNLFKKLASIKLQDLQSMKSNFDVYKEDERQKWAVVTSYCSYSGCDIPTYFEDETIARLYATILTLMGNEPSTNGICRNCHSEYITNCI